ncbi:MAG: AIPR family protein [Rhodocyclaceae bacterium]|nr:AIPR family protein [Rhodocyclaceae bacterium]
MSNTIDEFQQELLNEVALQAGSAGAYREDAFFRTVGDHLVTAGELETHERTAFQGRGLRIDGHGGHPDDSDGVLSLIVLDFDQSGDVLSLTASDMDAMFRRLTTFVSKARDPEFRGELEESSAGFEATIHINSCWHKAKRVKMLLVSNRRLSARIDGRESTQIDGKPVVFSVWDLDRLWRYVTSGREREDMELDLYADFGGPIAALPAHLGVGEYEAFLCVVPGTQLARIYDRWGSRLLEQNVRSFLQLKGNVNKGMARTIKETPDRFFAYNNGITATAEALTLTDDGRAIARIRNLQIVNGGQTTASLSYQHVRGESLERVFVQMKLSIIRPELAEEVVPKISEYANTQNKVNAADFFANHPFHIELEKLSRRMLAPPREGSFTQTRWFYERSRGQYLNERNKQSGAAQRKFDTEWPKGQMLTKTDLAKYLNLWPGEFGEIRPNSVCRGAQKNFSDFAQAVSQKWTDASLQSVNEAFFRECVAKAIIFRETERIVDERPWYEGGYRAQVVAHTIAKLAWEFQQRGDSLNFEKVWAIQGLTPGLRDALTTTSDAVKGVITSPFSPGQNITEWAKQQACWARIQELKIAWSSELSPDLQSVAEAKDHKKAAKKDKRELTGIEAQTEVIRLGNVYWQSLRSWAAASHALSPNELEIVAVAARPGKLPTEKQCLVAMSARTKALEAGFKP